MDFLIEHLTPTERTQIEARLGPAKKAQLIDAEPGLLLK